MMKKIILRILEIKNNTKKLLLDKFSEEAIDFKDTQAFVTPTPESNHNTKTFKLNLDKINQDTNNLNINKISDMTLTNQDGFSQIYRKDSKLNLSISRISLKNTFAQENTSSKLRSVYKKVNGDSLLNITNVKSSDNQFIKFFTNNTLYNENKSKDNNITSKIAAEAVKTKKPATTAKKLASDVITIYRKNISKQIKEKNEKNEAKEMISKQCEVFRSFADKIIKKTHIPEVDVETIMRSPIQKYAKSSFPCKNNQTYISIAKANVTAISHNSRVLSPIGNHKEKFKHVLEEEEKKQEESKIEHVIRKSLINYEHLMSKRYSVDNNLLLSINSDDNGKITEEELKSQEDLKSSLLESLFNNKYKALVSKISLK